MKPTITTHLSSTQIAQIEALVSTCCNHDQIRLSYPTDEAGDDCFHGLLFLNEELVAVLSGLVLEKDLLQCSAFTHPDHRNVGYFSQLLSHMISRFEDYNILFGVWDSCDDTRNTLQALGAELEYRELQMLLNLEDSTLPLLTHSHTHLVHDSGQFESDTWHLYDGSLFLGSCVLTVVSPTIVCLHHVTIHPEFQGQHYGSDLMTLLLIHLKGTQVSSILLQVSEDNTPALELYKKTGFRITETLSYYLY